ncbi:MAG: hypothetical protein JXE06_09785 [Coriobacteriia bacterium]|nr:hypothetical protein [Coriobacteriia bacterium]MBN2821718.1 hypothetical protein [Coriobacteriia bacterium]
MSSVPAPDPLAQNWELCHTCGGLCCALYLAHDENGDYIGDEWLPAYIEQWLGRFETSGALVRDGDRYVAGVHGIQPYHDPRLSHLPAPVGEAYRAGLPEWVDVRKCQFCHPELGCQLPHEYRPPICDEYRCELWADG